MEQGIFPNNMKIAEIVPIHKGGTSLNAITTDLFPY